MAFTIFYDGSCPLCAKEMNQLKRRNTQKQLAFVDIMQSSFSEEYPELDWQALNDRIHGMLEDGSMLIGLDATHKAWSLVGKGWLYAPLRWPIIRFFADKAYLVFARNRYRISYWVTGKQRSDYTGAKECKDSCEAKLK
ncbi:thiol-disulfide oxidoreductase DCC family protein [Glaciecola petra]|uniref:DUF393 domain-containing protein n=1 Tax=Glaciecola petra TaxID=3075602 RepID=A0ABU2ZV61_9ALTE|nr:DUF393 domain-containing protein [Aestuariibacter sp. P117]MDT0596536.1 DUF393 domain-containing protein [Aestuariibacter sp. P117]